ncbi:M24 family metallopeptidase [Microbacterium album]|uniref:Proline dipeptidase n=1 Tax=Microbacterium album TaxID=2053191 RepID=A0A917IF06_9MICO|nr:M24 family metallopeptidase [Microbacterium album]GGH42611.1 proline dipeptidase [Microbacterium album]
MTNSTVDAADIARHQYFSATETARRFAMLREIMAGRDIGAIVLIHNGPSPMVQEEFYFLQSDYVPLSRSVTIIPRHGQHVAMSTYLQAKSHAKNSTTSEVRIFVETKPQVEVLVETLRQMGHTSGVLGWRWEAVPATWHDTLRAEFPDIVWVDISSDLLDLWYRRSAEEAAACSRSAEIADAAYDDLLEHVQPGMSEYEIVSAFNHAATRHGANRNFTLVASGPCTPSTPLPELAPPTWRTVNEGDFVTLEMSPAYAGYYTQLVRTFQVGRGDSSEHADRLRQVAVDAVAEAATALKPGVTIGKVARVLMEAVSRAGYRAEYPLGHTVGVNLLYERLLPDNDRVLNVDDALIIHPKVHHANGDYGFFWGETYLVTETGSRSLNAASQLLRTTEPTQ